MAKTEGIDPANVQMVGRNGLGQVMVLLPLVRMTREQALVHAAWLVAIADDDDQFADYLAAVRRHPREREEDRGGGTQLPGLRHLARGVQ